MKQKHFIWLNAIFLTVLVTFFVPVAHAAEPASTGEDPVRVVIPDIELDSEVVPVGVKPVVIDDKTIGYQWLVDDSKVGWHNLSAKLGSKGNTVLNGHDENGRGQVFANLKYVEIGHRIIVSSSHQQYEYVVAEKLVVQEKGVSLEQRIENGKLIAPTEDERLTLITCMGANSTHRLILVAYPVK